MNIALRGLKLAAQSDGSSQSQFSALFDTVDQSLTFNEVQTAWSDRLCSQAEWMASQHRTETQNISRHSMLQDEDLAFLRGGGELYLSGAEHISALRHLAFDEQHRITGEGR